MMFGWLYGFEISRYNVQLNSHRFYFPQSVGRYSRHISIDLISLSVRPVSCEGTKHLFWYRCLPKWHHLQTSSETPGPLGVSRHWVFLARRSVIKQWLDIWDQEWDNENVAAPSTGIDLRNLLTRNLVKVYLKEGQTNSIEDFLKIPKGLNTQR